ncbi:MAG: valyl-tRNA ligase [Berkelbacteria bacterium GW2011_GWB1_38_5]|uniref:valine--tRNA ligase n=1 Tax=Berkelbacteria bacterium GW2011_GWB1_38_5 TaxID=1618336 RepID=A0A0G0NAM2_9BACT|nr:MAG: valyl-tRNA ligase [Berkelbacteria bacterium GW2011_GWB1_38_5]
MTDINTGIQDLKFDEEAIKAGQKFANKLWNIARFTIMNLENSKSEILNSKQIPNPKSQSDKQILEKLNQIIKSTDENLDSFRFGQAAHELYDFVWHDLADVYIEESKKDLNASVLLYVLISSLKLLHPIMPFVTESIWQNLQANDLVEDKLLINAEWPEPNS